MSTNYLSLRSTVTYVSSGVQPSTGTFYTVSTNGIPVWTSTLNGHIHISSLIGSTMIGHSTTLNLLTVNSTVTTSTLSALDLTTRSLGVSTLTGSSLTITNMDASGPVSIGTRLQGSVDGSNMFWTSLRGTGTEVDRVGFGIKGNVSTGLVDSLSFNTNSSNRMFIASTGNVGIGTNVPEPALHIYRSSTNPMIGLQNGSNAIFGIQCVDNARMRLGTWAGSNTLNDHLVITSAGNVGIGTTNPQNTLHVVNPTNSMTSICISKPNTAWNEYQTANIYCPDTTISGFDVVGLYNNGVSMYIQSGTLYHNTWRGNNQSGSIVIRAREIRSRGNSGNAVDGYEIGGDILIDSGPVVRRTDEGNGPTTRGGDIHLRTGNTYNLSSAAAVDSQTVDWTTRLFVSGTTGTIGIGTVIPNAYTPLTIYRNLLLTPQEFTVGGSRETYYRIRIDTLSLEVNNKFSITRGSVHTDGSWLGSMNLDVEFRANNCGHSSEFLSWKYRQYSDNGDGSGFHKFVGRVINDDEGCAPAGCYVYLNGNFTYRFSGIGCYLANSNTSGTGPTLSTPDEPFNTAGLYAICSYDSRQAGITTLGGKVGIGKTVPATELDVTGRIGVNNGVAATMAGEYQGVHIEYFGTGATGYARIVATNPGSTYNPIALNPFGGNVGIGITNPDSKLTILNNTPYINADPEASSVNATNLKIMRLIPDGNRALYLGQYVGRITFSGADYSWTAQKIGAEINTVISDVNSSGAALDMCMHTLTSPSDSAPTEKMRITRSGNVGIGTVTPSALLHVNGSLITQHGYHSQQGLYTSPSAQTVYFQIGSLLGQSEHWFSTETNGIVGATTISWNASTWNGTANGSVPITITGNSSSLFKNSIQGVYVINTTGSPQQNSAQVWIKVEFTGVGTFLRHSFRSGDIFDHSSGVNGVLITSSSTPTASASFPPTGYTTQQSYPMSSSVGQSVLALMGQNVGVGTATPSYPLDVNGSIRSFIPSSGYVSLTPGGANNTGYINFNNADNSRTGYIGFASASDFYFNVEQNKNMLFSTNSVERLRITSDGNVGIGTASPGEKLDISLSGTNSYPTGLRILQPDVATGGYGPHIRIGRTTGSCYNSGYISFAYHGDGSQANYITMGVACDATSPFQITGYGRVGIGITNPSYKLHVVGDIYASANVIAMSDQRVKRDIQPLGQTLDRLSSLHGYTYFRDGKDQREMGLIAQEVMSVFPEAVHYDKEQDRYGVNYGSLVAPLLESIKDLKKQVDALTHKVLLQEQQITTLMSV